MFKKINESFKEKINKPLFIISFVLFILMLVWIVFFKGLGVFRQKDYVSSCIEYNIPMNILDRIYNQFDFKQHKISLYIGDLFLNLLIFLPFGLFLPLLNKDKFKLNLLITFLISLFFEIFQLFTGIGGFQIFDLVNNIVGFIVGFSIYKLLIKLLNPKNLENIVINYASIFIVIIFVPFVIYAYTYLFMNFEIFLPCFNIDNYRNLFNFN